MIEQFIHFCFSFLKSKGKFIRVSKDFPFPGRQAGDLSSCLEEESGGGREGKKKAILFKLAWRPDIASNHMMGEGGFRERVSKPKVLEKAHIRFWPESKRK